MSAAFQIKGSLFTLSVLQVLSTALETLEQQITVKIKQAPQFFNNTPMVIDLKTIEKVIDIEFVRALNSLLQKHTLLPVGYRCQNKTLMQALIDESFPVFKEGKNIPAPQTSNTQQEKPQNRIIDTRIRSGQQAIAQNGDLVVLSSVSPGAELLAAGNIHVYGTLRGRAIAGLNGDTNARIFCQKLEADLVSIAGQYKIFEDGPPDEQAYKNGYQIQLKGGTIAITPL
ncbi:septum site-determining protein MinC [Facilibium subflavum]|uniref:septum site-determining protein MinC n=1 Tax=Facilibium subflavum TaxID=2219058 RepID=UPI000E65A16C|nr:septum site-determining protein MinC [Facilibium subflavum]